MELGLNIEVWISEDYEFEDVDDYQTFIEKIECNFGKPHNLSSLLALAEKCTMEMLTLPMSVSSKLPNLDKICKLITFIGVWIWASLIVCDR